MSFERTIATGTPSLLTRPAAYTVIDRCLALHSGAPTRSWLSRQLGLSPLGADARPWFIGALGERSVAELLEALPSGWTVVHSVPIGSSGADVDHLLIGPAGVFTINTKSVRGHVWVGRTRVLVSGKRKNFVASSEAEARRVHKQLTKALDASVFVRPMLVFVGTERLTFRENPASVTVLASPDLIDWLTAQEDVYPAHRVSELVDVAANPSTWQRNPPASGDTLRQLQRFDRLVAEVAEAERRWRSTLLAAALIVGIAVATTAAWVFPLLLSAAGSLSAR